MKTRKIDGRGELEKAIGGKEPRLVLFYSDYCPFCTSLLPSFEKTAERAPERFLRTCVDGPDALDDLFAVEVVPSVLCFSDGKLARRLDGRLGRGLSPDALETFAADCLAGGAGK